MLSGNWILVICVGSCAVLGVSPETLSEDTAPSAALKLVSKKSKKHSLKKSKASKLMMKPFSKADIPSISQQQVAHDNPDKVTPVKPRTEESFPDYCQGKIIHRKEVREMHADGDLPAFIEAFKATAKDGTLLQYVVLHQYQNTAYMHGQNPRFLPWHREYLKLFEQELISRGAKYLPYWVSSCGTITSRIGPKTQPVYTVL
jgi:hypothetical protein